MAPVTKELVGETIDRHARIKYLRAREVPVACRAAFLRLE
jgi:hypothetical protein